MDDVTPQRGFRSPPGGPGYRASKLEPSNPVIDNDLAPAADWRAPAVMQPRGGKDE